MYKVCNNLTFNEVEDGLVILNNSNEEVSILNQTGKEIVYFIQNNYTLAEIVSECEVKYTSGNIKNEIYTYIDNLISAKIIIENEEI